MSWKSHRSENEECPKLLSWTTKTSYRGNDVADAGAGSGVIGRGSLLAAVEVEEYSFFGKECRRFCFDVSEGEDLGVCFRGIGDNDTSCC